MYVGSFGSCKGVNEEQKPSLLSSPRHVPGDLEEATGEIMSTPGTVLLSSEEKRQECW